jgi:arginyl-tRNA synthetase
MPSATAGWPDVVHEIGEDAARFFVLREVPGRTVELDLEQARRDGANNPLSRFRLAHAGLSRGLQGAAAAGEEGEPNDGLALRARSTRSCACRAARRIARASHLLEALHAVAHALELAGAVHRYYNRRRMRVADHAGVRARLALVRCARHVLGGALEICAVTTAGRM